MKYAIINSILSYFHVLFRCNIYILHNTVPPSTILLQEDPLYSHLLANSNNVYPTYFPSVCE